MQTGPTLMEYERPSFETTTDPFGRGSISAQTNILCIISCSNNG